MRYLFTILLVSGISMASIGQNIRHVYLTAKMNGTKILEDGSTTDFWGFGHWVSGGQNRVYLPAPFLRFTVGDSVYIHLLNESPEDHTIHLHGLDVSQSNDGVPSTSLAIDPFSWGEYAWRADYSGTYLYHCHVLTTLHSAMGMYGMIIVEQDTVNNTLFPGSPRYDRNYEFLCSDHRQGWNVISPGPFNAYVPNVWLINGNSGTQMFQFPEQVIEAQVGDSVALRFGSVSYDKIKLRFPTGANPTVYMSDGRPIPTPLGADTLEIYPGERYTVVISPTTYIEDYIEVEYLSIYGDTLSHVNHIGINTMTPPQGIQEGQSPSNVSVYPNPTEGMINVEINSSDIELIEIYDLNGKRLKQLPANEGVNSYYLPDLPKGMYILQSNEGFIGKVILK